MMKQKGSTNYCSLFNNANDKSINNSHSKPIIITNDTKSNTNTVQGLNEDSLVILLKEENNSNSNNTITTSNIINKLILNAEDSSGLISIKRHQSLSRESKSNSNKSIGEISPNKRRGTVIMSSSHRSIDHSSSKDKDRCIRHMDKICDSSQEEESDLDAEEERSIIPIISYDNHYKVIWDYCFIVYVIMLTIFVPFIVSFTANTSYIIAFEVINTIVMSIEITLRFISSYRDNDDEDNIITKQRDIALNYLKTWFAIDFITFFPYSLCALKLLPSPHNEFNSRFNQDIDLLQKILLLIPLIQMLKILIKGQLHFIFKALLDVLRVGSQVERLIYFLFSFVLLNHIVACLWFFTANLQRFNPNCWVVKLGYIDHTIGELYLNCYSWSLATITTIGFGNISAGTSIERIYNLIVMLFGVVMFSFAIGSLSSIVNISDNKAEELNQKLQMLSLIKKTYKIDKETYQRICSSIKYEHNNNHNSLRDNNTFLKSLPPRLSLELTKAMLDSKIKEMHFFIKYPSLFAYIAPYLKSVQFIQRDVLYKPNDKIEEMYFISGGTVSYCLDQEYNEKEIKMIKKHNHFGVIEMCIGEVLGYSIKVKSRACELFVLKKGDFIKLNNRFKETIEEFMQKSLMIYIRFKEKMKKMVNKFNKKDDIGKTNISNDESLWFTDGGDDKEDGLECIFEEEGNADNESGASVKKGNEENGAKDFNSDLNNNNNNKEVSDRNSSSMDDSAEWDNKKEDNEEIQRLRNKFDTKLNDLIDYIRINNVNICNDNLSDNDSPMSLLIQIQNTTSSKSLEERNFLLQRIQKMLSDAITLT